MRKLKLFFACLLMAVLSIGQVWADEGDELAICQGTGSGYGTRRTNTDSHSVGWVLASGQINQGTTYLGANSAANHNKVKPTAADLPVVKAINSDATTETTGYYFYYTSTSLSNVGSIAFSYTANSGNNSATAYVVSCSTAASDGSATWSQVSLTSGAGLSAQGVSLGTSGTFTFKFASTETSAKYYGIVIVASSYKRMTDGTITIKEGATGGSNQPTISADPDAIAFGTKNIHNNDANKTGSLSINVTGSNLKGDITATINGTNKTSFSLSSSSAVYSTTLEESAGAYDDDLTIYYSITEADDYEATLTLSTEDAEDVEIPITLSIINENLISDVLTRATTGINSGSTTYGSWSGKHVTSDAVYAGQSAGGNDAIQLRTQTPAGIVTTTSGGKVKKVTVEWNSNTATNTPTRTVKVYGKNTAYAVSADLYGEAPGEELGTIVYGTGTELTVSGDYKYIGIAAINGALYLNKITIDWIPAEKYAIDFSAVGGTLTINDGESDIESGDTYAEDAVLTLTSAPTGTYISPVTYKVIKKGVSPEEEVTNDVLNGTTLTMPAYPIVVTAAFTPTYAITKVAEGGSINLEYNANGAPAGRALAGTEITATAAADGTHTFKSLSLSDNVTVSEINENVAVFTMPNGDVTVTASFDEKIDPSVTVKDNVTALDFGSVAKESTPVAQTFKISGTYLTEGQLTIESANTSHFTVAPASIDVNGTLAETTITVTPVTSTPFESTTADKIIISGGGLAANVEIGLSMIVLPTYTVTWHINGATSTSPALIAGADLDIPEVTPSGNCADLYFRGWVAEAIDGSIADEADVEFVTPTTMPENGADYYAVFATRNEDVTKTEYSYTIMNTTTEFPGNSYGNNNNEKTRTATCTTDGTKTVEVKWTSYQVMHNNTSGTHRIQGQGGAGKIYNEASWGTIKSITINDNDGASEFSYVIGNSANPTASAEGGFFEISAGSSTSKASSIEIVFEQSEVSYTYSNFVTTCVACTHVDLEAENVEHGSISFATTEPVTSVRTCDGSDVNVNVVAEPADGYVLSTVNLSGVANATYSNGVITIPQDATGTLTAEAVFAAIDYNVTMAQTGDADATLSDNQENKHYGDVITVTAEDKDGYAFLGWVASPAVEFADAKALSTTFDMPNGNIEVTATYIKVYNVDEFNALGNNRQNNAYYCIEGLIASIGEEVTYNEKKEVTYTISNTGATTGNTLSAYKGLGLDEASLPSENLSIGSYVRVYGKWNSQHTNLNAGNYQLAYTAATLQNYEIVGELGKTTFFDGDEWLDSYMSGLSLVGIYNTAYRPTIDGVTFEANKTTLTTSDGTITISAIKNEATLTSKDFAITVSDATLESYVLKDGYKTEYYVGEAFEKPYVIGTLSDANSTDEEATSCSGYDMNNAGVYTVTVTYTYGTTTLSDKTYQITVKAVANDNEHPYTVAEARQIIDIDRIAGNNLDLANDDNKVYVRGIVTDVTSTNIQINVAANDDAPLYLYKYEKGTNFETNVDIEDVTVGETIIAYGNLLFYQNQQGTVTKYELNEGCEVVWKQPTAVTEVSLNNASVKVGKSITLVPTFQPANASNKNVTWSIISGNDKISMSGATITGQAEGEAVVQVETEDGGLTATCTITVTPGVNFNNGVWQLVTDAGTLQANDYLVIASNTQDAVAGNISSQVMAVVDVEFSDDANKTYIKSLPSEAVILKLGGSAGAWTLANEDEEMLGATAVKKLAWDGEEATNTWAITIDNNNNATIQNGTSDFGRFLHNVNSTRFTTYASAPTNAMLLPQLYKFTTLEDYTRNVTNGNYGTICLPYGGTITGATLYNLNGKDINNVYIEEAGTTLEAGKPYIFQASASQISVTYNTYVYTEPTTANGLHGTFVNMDQDALDAAGDNIYVLSSNTLYKVDGQTGNQLKANRAYIDLDELTAPVLAPGKKVRSIPMQGQTATGMENVQGDNVQCTKVLIDGQMYILRGEKLYDAKGQLVK